MTILAAIFLSLFLPLVILALQRTSIRRGFQWLLAVLGAFAIWLMILAARPQIPTMIELLNWQGSALAFGSPQFTLDSYSWFFAAAISTLMVAVLLTDATTSASIDPNAWAATMAFSGLGLVAIFAGNPLTLVLAWALIDLVEAWILLERVEGSPARERVVVAFSMRAAGNSMVVLAMLWAHYLGTPFSFAQVPAQVSVFLLLAAGFRLGILPPHQPFISEPPLRRSLGTVIRLAPVASSLVLLVRAAEAGAPAGWRLVLLILALASALMGGLAWLLAKSELDGRPYWILSAAALAFIAATVAAPQASLWWGLALLFGGGIVFLKLARNRRWLILFGLGFIGITALPFTPAWYATQVYSHLPWLAVVPTFLAHVILLAGFLRHALRVDSADEPLESWVQVIYPSGLALLPLTQIGIWLAAWSGNPAGAFTGVWWAGLLASGLAFLLWVWTRRKADLVSIELVSGSPMVMFDWLYRIFWRFYYFLTSLFDFMAHLLEGEGGVLWAILFFLMLTSIFF
jgi:hypothetical protein